MEFPSPEVELPDCQLNWEKLKSLIENGGGVFYSPGDLKTTFAVNPPAGWILLTGQTVNPIETVYPKLAEAMGVTGSVTFPDCRGRAIVGAGAGAGLTNRAIRSVFGSEASNMPSHNHGGATGGISVTLNHTHSVAGARNTVGGFSLTNLADPPSAAAIATEGVYSAAAGVDLQHTHTIPLEGGGGPDNMPPAVAANIMMRVS